MKKYEYTYVTTNHQNYEGEQTPVEECNTLGLEGWEMVGAPHLSLWFKRELSG